MAQQGVGVAREAAGRGVAEREGGEQGPGVAAEQAPGADVEGARDLLEEVVARATGTLRAKAQTMLDNLG